MKTQSNLFITLKNIAVTHRKKLFYTFSLVGVENLSLMLYPVIAGVAINAVVAGEVWKTLIYVLLVLVVWGVGSARRAVDTRTFVRIYAELVVPVIMNERQNNGSTSTTTARVALSREFVNFFEQHLPTFITAFFSIIGSVVMLLAIEFWSGVIALIILAVFGALMPKYIKANDHLYFRLNNRLEKEVDLIERTKQSELLKHYDVVSRLRIAISNREAFSFLAIGLAVAVLFGVTLTMMTLKGYGSAGHIYAVITYMWTFAISLDDMPRLVEEYSQLKDIGNRIDV
ncbi:ABC transporter six-transmembrane domain-containing protein [Caviibacterium pharyngocola]|uniref:ABC transmembrane type-1 domain-containing protein n=1 Tax=Caviibacterium pharyngocola TaxID=28159 RepID=A0A2M8RTQ6_9PAST|nr:ABC transporter six-transmembrane domain-containing protein [Caviibacterium pharyngocola]PJG82269.1 hypothetical protein CVP04_09905 [Caviibacterium pharyngocola]